jgi:hypothetical protein
MSDAVNTPKQWIADQQSIFNHALSHHVTQIAGYGAMIGILLTIGFFYSLTPITTGPHVYTRVGVVVIIIAVSLRAALYFIGRMNRYGKILNDRLPQDYLNEFLWHLHKHTIRIGQIAALSCAALDYYLLFFLFRK